MSAPAAASSSSSKKKKGSHVVWKLDHLKETHRQLVATANTNTKGCRIVIAKPSETRYVKVKVQGSAERKEEFVHRIALMVKHNATSLDPTLETSHLCHIKRCVNTDHLVLETKRINDERNYCRVVTCPCGCNHSFSTCTHNPPCIL